MKFMQLLVFLEIPIMMVSVKFLFMLKAVMVLQLLVLLEIPNLPVSVKFLFMLEAVMVPEKAVQMVELRCRCWMLPLLFHA